MWNALPAKASRPSWLSGWNEPACDPLFPLSVPGAWHAVNDLITLETSPPLARLTLNRPERHNSLVPELPGFAAHLDEPQPYALEIVGLLNEVICRLVDYPLPVVAATPGELRPVSYCATAKPWSW
jgi:hypothetical protein